MNKRNAMLMTLLAYATREQIEEFMECYKQRTEITENSNNWSYEHNFLNGADDIKYCYDNLGKQLLYVSRAKDLVSDEIFKAFMNNVAKNPDLFPSYNEYVGIAFGNQL